MQNDITTLLLDCIREAMKPAMRRIDDLAARVDEAENAGSEARGPDTSVTLDGVKLALEGMRPDIMLAVRETAADEIGAAVDAEVSNLRAMHDAAIDKWALDFERRAQDVLQRAIDRTPAPRDGKDGKDGRDGRDGMGFDDMTVEHDGIGGVTLRMARGEAVKEFRLQLPCLVDRGVYDGAQAYRSGDAVSYGGSLWIAQKDAPQGKPGAPVSDWRLAVKKGRDGKDGCDGKAGARGPQGRDASILDAVRPQP